MKDNSSFIEQELQWVSALLQRRLKLYFNQEGSDKTSEDILPPNTSGNDSAYCRFLLDHKLDTESRLLLILAFIPLLRPQLFDSFSIRNSDTDQRFVEFGGVKGATSNLFIPTLETFLFLLCGDDIAKKINQLNQFTTAHPLFQSKSLLLEPPANNEPYSASVIVPSVELIELLLKGESSEPVYSASFPAKKISTEQSWKDLILEEPVFRQIEEIIAWVEFGDELQNTLGLGDKMSPGHRCLFYGPSGTGKTLTASLIGKQTGLQVYRIDLSQVAVSKYIGETEKNLSRIFDLAENKNWILFFDEADALFGKRTQVRDAHDRFANQEVSYLLQRVEEYSGLVILATNFKTNIDEAFARRFQSVIHFPIPKAQQREQLWRNMLPKKLVPEPSINLERLSSQYELSGGAIINIIRYASLMALKRGSGVLLQDEVMEGIKREYVKEGKAM